MEQTKSFYDIVSKYIIEVPIIQREYAQGRNTEKVKSIRKRFVTDLAKTIINNEEIHLGFVYGKIEGKENLKRKILNKEAVSSILEAVKFYAHNLEFKISANIEETEDEESNQNLLKFIPLDGQQRLTTLYLLYWYLYFKGAKSKNNDWLSHFKYSNRKSSLSFCKELVNAENIDSLRKKQKKNAEINIKELITNSSFFLKKWSKDSTVSGMLEMLLSIESAFDSDFDYSKINVKELPFTFDFMDLDSLNQTDDLYVKMNSRGKQLSDYEHFKSWLQEYHKETEDNVWMESFWKKLDTVWLNYFWRNIDSDFSALDDFFYNYIKNLALMYCLANNKEIPFEKLRESYNLIRNTEVYDNQKISYIPLEKYFIKWIDNENKENNYFLFNADSLKFIEQTFDSLIYLEQNDRIKEFELPNIVCNPFIENLLSDFFLKSNLFTPTLWHSVFYYSFIIFINDRNQNEFTVTGLQNWLRFTRNIIYNTYIQSPENFNSALKQINNIEHLKFQINDALLNNKVENVFFENSQFEEEKIKIVLINEEGWKEQIQLLENHSYLYGQINFVLEFAKDESGDYSLVDFIRYGSAVMNLYSKEIRQNAEKILERFLLCEDFYLPNYKSDYIFCSGSLGGLRTKNENWRMFFKGSKINALKEVIDKLEDNQITPQLLTNYISDYLESSNLKKSNWKYLFLKFPQAISYCKETAIRKESENDIRLLKGFPIFAYHSELRSYCLFLEFKDKSATKDNRISPAKFSPFTKFWYFKDKNTDGHPGVYFEGFSHNNRNYKLEIRYSKTKEEFELLFFHKEEIENRVADVSLENLSFVFDSNFKHYFKSVPFDKIENELDIICLELKTVSQ
ncbi:GmrSD restriction endonuclease domain-containing protein [Chryseobacterium camelliae]|uniref:GmrSD restriction endonuclease domain-containing protein n=1 Tax=Chryseobacterium camelliae TaxID=1265445 RepID=UPI000C1CA4C0|nr:DUF262 domain-containing protein [Chryseobacterium camelliae]